MLMKDEKLFREEILVSRICQRPIEIFVRCSLIHSLRTSPNFNCCITLINPHFFYQTFFKFKKILQIFYRVQSYNVIGISLLFFQILDKKDKFACFLTIKIKIDDLYYEFQRFRFRLLSEFISISGDLTKT